MMDWSIFFPDVWWSQRVHPMANRKPGVLEDDDPQDLEPWPQGWDPQGTRSRRSGDNLNFEFNYETSHFLMKIGDRPKIWPYMVPHFNWKNAILFISLELEAFRRHFSEESLGQISSDIDRSIWSMLFQDFQGTLGVNKSMFFLGIFEPR